MFELAAIVDDYVFGCALRGHASAQFGAAGDAKRRLDAMVGYLNEQLGTGDYPHLEAIAGDDPAAGFARIGHLASDEQRFERGLQALLDGLELWVGRARGASARGR
jgi:Tetracyclin repressor-like, C-terminal domain